MSEFIREPNGILWDAVQIESIEHAKLMAAQADQLYADWTPKQIARFQLFQKRLCMPFPRFHKAMEEALGRPVWTHEFGLNLQGLQAELLGIKGAPTFEEILGLIPPDKLIVVNT